MSATAEFRFKGQVTYQKGIVKNRNTSLNPYNYGIY